MASRGPLSGVKVVEYAGLAPGPFCGMVLADFGASVIRIDPVAPIHIPDVLGRGKRSIAIALVPNNVAYLKKLTSDADVVIDPLKRGVLDNLDLGYADCQATNPRVIYARISGYPDGSPHDKTGMHDIHALAASGLLSIMRSSKADNPLAPANFAAAFGGGGMTAVVGILLALYSREVTGLGQMVDANMIQGTRYLGTLPLLLRRPSMGMVVCAQEPGKGLLDGSAPFYCTYRTADGRFLAVGIFEPHYYRRFLDALRSHFQEAGIDCPLAADQMDRSKWPELRRVLTALFLRKSLDAWMAILGDKNVCVTAVVEPEEVQGGEQEALDPEGGLPEVAPILSETPGRPRLRDVYASLDSKKADPAQYCLAPGQHTTEILQELGCSKEEISSLVQAGRVQTEFKGYAPHLLSKAKL